MSYNPKSCSALQKPYYSPVEAALRWCNLIEHEPIILTACASNPTVVPVNAFPHWPCLRSNTENIVDALKNGDMPKARDGKVTTIDDHVAPARLTVRHTDLKAWMTATFPRQKPAFLFDEIERSTHAAINADTFRALQADRDALQARIKKAEDAFRELRTELNQVKGERDSLRAMVAQSTSLNERAETTYLNIIGGLLGLMMNKSPAGVPYSILNSQASVISALLGHYPDKQGIAARTLEEKFAAAKRSLNSN